MSSVSPLSRPICMQDTHKHSCPKWGRRRGAAPECWLENPPKLDQKLSPQNPPFVKELEGICSPGS